MTHQVIPRKYRPQTFDELIGQESISRCFKSMIERNVIPHAILLCGTRGIGKTSTARIFAKALLCENPKESGNPCAYCTSCKQVEKGSHLDVLEIDGASNNGVEAVRELRETARFLPSQGKHKIYIIDEVHMLSNSAFNALLKILEEPPPHLVFIFATTEPGQLPPTILSRVMRFDFYPIKTPVLAAHLSYITGREGRTISKSALNKIASLGDGSMRDAEMLLEQVFAFFDESKAIDLKDLENLFSLINNEMTVSLLKATLAEDTPQVMTVFSEMLSKGYDPYDIGLELQRFLRYLLLVISSPPTLEEELSHTPEMIEQISSLSKMITTDTLLIMFQCLLKSLQTMRYSDHPQWVFEACLIQLSKVSTWAISTKSLPEPKVVQQTTKPINLPPIKEVTSTTLPPTPPLSSETTQQKAFLRFLLSKDPLLYGLIQSCDIEMTKDAIIIKQTNNAFTFEKLKDKRNIQKLTDLCKGTSYEEKRVVFSGGDQTSNTDKLKPDLAKRKERLLKHPLVNELMKELDAEISKVVVDSSIVS